MPWTRTSMATNGNPLKSPNRSLTTGRSVRALFAESELDNSDPDDRFDTPVIEDEPVAPDMIGMQNMRRSMTPSRS